MNIVTASFAILGVVCGYVATSSLACSSCNCPEPRPLASGEFEGISVVESPEGVFPELGLERVNVDLENGRVELLYRPPDDARSHIVTFVDASGEPGQGGAD